MVLSSRRAAQTRDDATGMAGSALSVAEVAEGAAPNSCGGAWCLKPDPGKPDVRILGGDAGNVTTVRAPVSYPTCSETSC